MRDEPMAGGLLAFGMFGVVVTSGLYGAAPPIAALPFPTLDVAEVARQTLAGAGLLRAAGNVGLVGDMAIIAGAWLLMITALRDDRSRASAGWALVALATLSFVGVDALAGHVLPQLAGSPLQFEAPRRVFDVLWLAGTATFGVGGLLAIDGAVLRRAPVAGWVVRAIAAVSLLSSLALVLGAQAGLVMGLSIGGGALALGIVGLRLARPAVAS